ncbi:MAG TPA: hypothetical protein VF066_13870, partial [Thermoleophilaceae bacterium]
VHPKESLGATDDCGLSPFSRDLKPKHGSPDFARDVAMQKIRARLEARGWRPRSSGSRRVLKKWVLPRGAGGAARRGLAGEGG